VAGRIALIAIVVIALGLVVYQSIVWLCGL